MKKYTILTTAMMMVVLNFSSNCLAADPSPSPQQQPYTPESILPAGVDTTVSTNPYTGESGPIRKGTAAATLNNVALLNKILVAPPGKEDSQQAQKIIAAMKPLMPSLRVIGAFDMFSVKEWLADENQPGRITAGVLYLQQYPNELTPLVKQELKQILAHTKSKVLAAEINNVLNLSK